jgi:hypothetical protein
MRPPAFWLHWCAPLVLGLAGIFFALPARAQPADAEAPTDAASESPADSKAADRVSITGQWFWMQGKAMPGIELGMGRGLFELNVEISFVTLTQPSANFDGSLLGNQFGAYAMLTPLRNRYCDLSVGLGGDFYLLWGIHSDARKGALAPRLVARVWPSENLALTFSARSYLVHGVGLDLGTARDGSSGPPILLSTGITWGFH